MTLRWIELVKKYTRFLLGGTKIGLYSEWEQKFASYSMTLGRPIGYQSRL